MAPPFDLDLVLRNGTLYDGSGAEPRDGDVGVRGDRIAAIGKLEGRGQLEIDAAGLAVAPGFINMLSWANESLIADGRSQSDIRQGVTLEVLGEGISMGPLSEALRQERAREQGDIRYDIGWTTLGEYLDDLAGRGISPNVGSFVGATTIRVHVLGHADRPPNLEELGRMRRLVSQAMQEGALGISSALGYVPGCYATTEELVSLAQVAAEYGGLYLSHLRSEGPQLLEAVDELIAIAARAAIGAEIYHLKASGKQNWPKLGPAIEKITAAREQGLRVSANMYPYSALSTSFEAAMPPWVQEGGIDAWVERLRDPDLRARVRREVSHPGNGWDNTYLAAGSPENIIAVGFKNRELKPLSGKTLAEISALRGTTPEETMMDLVVEDHSGLEVVFKTVSEDNLRQEIRMPWISFGSDSPSLAPEGVFLQSSIHPRAYGTFARLLGRFVREEGLIPLREAVQRLSSLPAGNLHLDRRGLLAPGYFADIVVFDPETIQDHATFDDPHRYSTGVHHVVVNGQLVLRDGEHTGALPGRVVRGPGRRRSEAVA
ncbi:MAG: D-aminoacylase [Anaerolineales bacterium]